MQPAIARKTSWLILLACAVPLALFAGPNAKADTGSPVAASNDAIQKPWLDANGDPRCVWSGVNSGTNPVYYCGSPLAPEESMEVAAQAAVTKMTTASKTATQSVDGIPPSCAAGDISNTRAPVIQGNPVPHSQLNVDPGSWFVCGGFVVGFAYGWTGNTEPAGSSYTVPCSDIGHDLQVTVTATSNVEGSTAVAASSQVHVNDDGSCAAPPPPPPTPAPNVNLTANSYSVASGEQVVLTYSGSGSINSCTESGGAGDGWGGYPPSYNGTFTTGKLYSKVTYTYECTGPGGTTVKSVTIDVSGPAPPAITSFYTDAGINVLPYPNTGTVVRWSCINSNAATASGGWSGIKATSGWENTGPLAVSTSYTLVCNGPAGNSSPATINVSVAPAPDSIAPSTPASLHVAGTAANALTVQWSPSSDNIAVTGYGLYKNGASVGTTPQTSTTFSGLACGTTYTLAVDAYDAAGNRSAKASINATTAACPLPPPTMVSFTSNTAGPWAGNSVMLSWAATNGPSCKIDSSPTSGGAASGLLASGNWGTPSLASGTYKYTVSCSNAAGTAQATLYIGVFNSDERVVDSTLSSQNTDPSSNRSLDSAANCHWKSETNQNDMRTAVGLRAGGIATKVDWCVRGGRIIKVVRTVSLIGPNYPFSNWKFNGISSLGPCDEQCGNFASLYGTNRTQLNIWVQGHWSLCLSLPVIGDLCSQDTFRTVGVLIRGDGTRVDTYAP